MKILGWIAVSLLIFTGAVIAAKGPLTGTESISISQITMDSSGNLSASYTVIFSGDPRYNRFGEVKFNSAATKQLVSDALAQATLQEGL